MNYQISDGDAILKQATAFYNAGNIDEAIKALKKAYSEIEKNEDSYSIEMFIRLPMYLQKAGRVQEAWDELNRLLRDYKFFPQNHTYELKPMAHSTIYDKMRLLLQRNNQSKLAVPYGVASHYSWCLGLYRQERLDELKYCLSRECEIEAFVKLLTKAESTGLLESLLKYCDTIKSSIPELDISTMIIKICEIMKIEV